MPLDSRHISDIFFVVDLLLPLERIAMDPDETNKKVPLVRGKHSTEREEQSARERGVLAKVYISTGQIPDNPALAAEEKDYDPSTVRLIPFDQVNLHSNFVRIPNIHKNCLERFSNHRSLGSACM